MTATALAHRRHLYSVDQRAEVLRDEIAEICAQVDRRLGVPMHTTLRGIYFWYWPPGDIHNLDVLTRLHADAVAALADATAGALR